jgi:hypothetical protein
MKHGQCVGSTRFTVDCHEYPTTRGEGIKNSSIVRLKSDATHGARNAKMCKPLVRSLKRGH